MLTRLRSRLPAASAGSWVLGVVAASLALAFVTNKYLIAWPQDQWQVDIEVYWRAGVALWRGEDLYSFVTDAPQLLPFTYPPFAALLMLPLALLPFVLVAWGWLVVQLIVNAVVVLVAGWPLWQRAGRWWPALWLGLVGALALTQPIADGIKFGQVNFLLVALVLADLGGMYRLRTSGRRWLPLPPGVLIGIATAIKLTPGVFIVHLLATRRFKEAGTAIATATAATVGTWLILPRASFQFWGGALQSPGRLGDNTSSQNQSLRGVFLRMPISEGAQSALYLIAVGVVLVLGFTLARRAYRQGEWVSEAGIVWVIAFLISPVSWVHHMHALLLIVPALLALGLARGRWRTGLLCAALSWLFFYLTLPFWGDNGVREERAWQPLWLLMQNFDTLAALLILGFFALLLRRNSVAFAPDERLGKPRD